MTFPGLFARSLLLAMLSGLVAQASGCGTDAEGVDECRDIEQARCEAGQYCQDLVEDVDACKRFYRDQCLHGMASGSKPGAPVVRDCVNLIKRAGDCARNGVQSVADCPELVGKTVLATPCDVIRQPEQAIDCDFLFKPVEIPEAGPETSEEASSDAGSDAVADAPLE